MTHFLKLNNPLFKTLSENNAFLSIVFNALGKGVYFLFILLVGRLINADSQTDIYFFTIEFIKVVIGYSAVINSDILIPRIIGLKTRASSKLSPFISFFYSVYTIIGVLATLIIVLFPQFSLTHFSKFSSAIINDDYLIFCYLFPTALLNIINGLQSSILTAYNRFIIPPLVTLITNCLCLLIFLVFYKSSGLQAAILGIIIASIINNLVLTFYIRKYCAFKFNLTFKIDFTIFKSIGFATIPFIASSIYYLGLIYILSAAEESTTTAYNNAVLIAFVPYNFIGVQLTTILGTRFSELYNLQKYDELVKHIKRALIILTVTILPISLFSMFFFTDIIKLIMGEKVTDNWSYFYRISMMLKYLSLQAFFNSIYLCGIRLYTSALRIRTSSIVQAAASITLLVADYIGFRYFDVRGFCFGSFTVSFCMFLTGIILIMVFMKTLKTEENKPNLIDSNAQTQTLSRC